jgi:uncharacterized protein YndB with AHSA1/START domain
MKKPDYVYVTYIASTPEKVWEALTVPETTRMFWFNSCNRSDWKNGSAWSNEEYDDASDVNALGTVVESTPPSKLVLTWASPADANDASKHSRVTIEISSDKAAVRLQITHDELDQVMLESISFGWPRVLSNLKTLLETGKTLPTEALGECH